MLIVPCEEGEETEYVARDEFLKSIVDLDEDGVPLNVQSAARSKGLEFKRVGLYGWSKRPEPNRIASLLKKGDKAAVDVDEKLQLEYFMNNLYVAASRAQRRLFIIDNPSSKSSLWWIVDDEEHLQNLTTSLTADWRNHIGTMVDGGSESFRHDKDTNKRRAEQQKTEGLSKRSTFTLKQAARYFELDNNTVEANRCRGFAFLFARRFADAATHFEASSDISDAVNSLWLGRLFVEIADLSRRNPQHATLPECQIAVFINDSKSSVRECGELFQNLTQVASVEPRFSKLLCDPNWSNAIEKVLRKIAPNSAAQGLSGTEADLVVDPLTELIKFGLSIDKNILASIHYAAENFEIVIDLLKDNTASVYHRDAKAMLCLTRSERGEDISDADARYVGEYLLRQTNPDFEVAARHFFKAKILGKQLECFRLARDSRTLTDDSLATILQYALDATLRHGDWGTLVALALRGNTTSESVTQGKKKVKVVETDPRVTQIIDAKRFQWTMIVPFLANSQLLIDDSGQEKFKVQDYLKSLISNQDWRKLVGSAEMGAAIERAGKDIDALQFYEDWKKRTSDPGEAKYADIRWVICKLRQAARQNSDANRKEAQRVMDKFGWDEEMIKDEYPVLRSVAHERSPSPKIVTLKDDATPSRRLLKDRERTKIGDLEFLFLQSKGWINIESSDGLQARVIISEQVVESTDVDMQKSENGDVVCDSWNLSIFWRVSQIVELRHNGHEITTMRSES